MVNLFRNNALKGEIHRYAILKQISGTKITCLVSSGETPFKKTVQSRNVFVKLFNPIIVSLYNIQEIDSVISTKAYLLLAAVEKNHIVTS